MTIRSARILRIRQKGLFFFTERNRQDRGRDVGKWGEKWWDQIVDQRKCHQASFFSQPIFLFSRRGPSGGFYAGSG